MKKLQAKIIYLDTDKFHDFVRNEGRLPIDKSAIQSQKINRDEGRLPTDKSAIQSQKIVIREEAISSYG